jgi:hypothetical protein
MKRSPMVEALTIAQADALNSSEVLVVLSDGRSLILDLNGIINAEYRVVLPIEEDDDATYYPRVTN